MSNVISFLNFLSDTASSLMKNNCKDCCTFLIIFHLVALFFTTKNIHEIYKDSFSLLKYNIFVANFSTSLFLDVFGKK